MRKLGFGEFQCCSLGFELCGFSGSFLEFIDGTCGVDQVLLACVERVAIRANFNMQLVLGRAGGKSIAAGANYFRICEILWV